MTEEMKEYVTFTVKAKNGSDVEMAVVDTFEFDGRAYVAASRVVDDAVDEESIFLYRLSKSADFQVEQITSAHEMREVSEAYMEMMED